MVGLRGGAGVATPFAGRFLAIEARRDKRLELAGRQEQANKVAAWLEGRDDGEIDVIVRNASDLPVYRLTAYMYELEHHSLHSEYLLQPRLKWAASVVAPGQDVHERIDVREADVSTWRVALEFTDTSTNTWSRDSLGVLEEGYLTGDQVAEGDFQEVE